MREFARFALLEVRSSVFALGIFAGLALSWLSPIPRYDFMLAWGLGLQAWMLLSGRESGRELAVVSLFHLLGLGLEWYKVTRGSWAYPESAWTKIGPIPLYSGFMYSAVASYMLQARRELDLTFDGLLPRWANVPVLLAVYANFLLARSFGDNRYLIIAVLVALSLRATVRFRAGGPERRMPLLVAMGLIGVFVWVAENICTALGAWVYPHQRLGWRPVEMGKISSWGLMVTVAFLLLDLFGGFRRAAPTLERSGGPR